MAFEQKPETCSLFRNEDKQSASHADYSGTAIVDGVEYWANGWINEIKSGENKGKKYLNIKFKKKDGQRSGGSSQQSASGSGGDPRDEAGF